jgi:hypothetical protein
MPTPNYLRVDHAWIAERQWAAANIRRARRQANLQRRLSRLSPNDEHNLSDRTARLILKLRDYIATIVAREPTRHDANKILLLQRRLPYEILLHIADKLRPDWMGERIRFFGAALAQRLASDSQIV